MLKSAGFPVHKTVAVHGFINDAKGEKMSKSIGNVVNPHEVCDVVPADSFRWYLCRAAEYGHDMNFSPKNMKMMHDADLGDNLGNLVARATAVKLVGTTIPAFDAKKYGDVPKPFDLEKLRSEILEAVADCRTGRGAELIRAASAETNQCLDLRIRL